jgi:hypothetical protein
MKVTPPARFGPLTAMLLLVTLVFLEGCGSDDGESSGAAPTTSVIGPAPTGPATTGPATTGPATISPAATRPVTTGGKPLPPLDVGLELSDAPLEIGRQFRVTLQLAPREAVNAVRAEVRGSGVVTVVESGAATWTGPVVGGQLTIEAVLRIAAGGPGEIVGTVEALDDVGQVRYGRSDTLSVLAAETEVLTGRAGELQLRLDHLDHERAAGRVGEIDYQRLREEILGGGSTTTP